MILGWRGGCWEVGGWRCPRMVTGEKDTGEVESEVIGDEIAGEM